MSSKISRSSYSEMYGPTTGDKIRLADTDLFIEVENDFTVYGEEVKFGGGKVIRDGMGQSQVTRKDGAVDTVITNALIVDINGIYKADIGIKDGLINKIGNHKISCVSEGKDQFKRTLAECFVNNESLSSFLVRSGYAFAYRKYSKKFISDEEFAKSNQLGMWDMQFDFPWDYRKSKKK